MSLVLKKEMLNVEFEYENGSGSLEGVKWDYAHKDVAVIYENEVDGDFHKFAVYIKDIPSMIEALQETLKYSKEYI